MARSADPKPPKRLNTWNGHSRKGQAWENDHFKFEQDMADKYDPVSDMYDHLD